MNSKTKQQQRREKNRRQKLMTSWSSLQCFETFDPAQAKAFYRANLNRAPEPDAP